MIKDRWGESMCALPVLKYYELWALIIYDICMYEIHEKWWYDLWYELVHVYECMQEYEVYVWCMKVMWIWWMHLCEMLLETWIYVWCVSLKPYDK